MCADAPCVCDCPAGVDARAFIRKVRFDNLDGAVRMLRRYNVLAGSCAYICPTGVLCGKECSAESLSRPIDIQGLQRFVMEYERRVGMIEPLASKRTGKRIAVVGAGPAGLGCAAELAGRDHSVTVFEREAAAGGMLGLCIPSFRLPLEVLDFEIEFIRKLGVEFAFNTSVDDPKRLLAEGFDAVFVATGLDKPRESGFVGADIPGVYQALDFLRAAKRGEIQDLGKRAVVIGGGDTALDAARTARSLGVECLVLYRRTQREMPAYPEEIDAAWDEGVEFYFRTVVHAVHGPDRTTGARCVRVRWREKVPGLPHAFDVEGTEFTIACDSVIIATGHDPASTFGLRTTPGGMLAVDRATFATSVPGVFAGGDIAFGGGTAARAVGHGRLAALAIEGYLGVRP
ncbi:MAG: FAD-dependent oxidoreductase, partial [bacterium]